MLSSEEKERYSRQIMLPEIGTAGQEKLKKASVLIAGSGGLGSAASYYLAAMGIGTLHLVDADSVALSNLNRQIIHWMRDIGTFKTASAANKIKAFNPNTIVKTCVCDITSMVDDSYLKKIDIILDATDNLKTRKYLNRLSVITKTPYIFGGIDGFNGMVSTFIPGKTPCLDCVLPGERQKSGTIGVAGPLCGIIASIQCVEAVKLLLNIGELLAGKMLHFRGLRMAMKVIEIEKSPGCKVCSSF